MEILAEKDCNHLKIRSQNTQGLKNSEKIENIINAMESHKIDIYLVQETWLKDNFSKEISGHRFMHHGLKDHKSHRGERGVGIFLSPLMTKAHAKANETPRLTFHSSDLDGRFISIELYSNTQFSPEIGAFRGEKSTQT